MPACYSHRSMMVVRAAVLLSMMIAAPLRNRMGADAAFAPPRPSFGPAASSAFLSPTWTGREFRSMPATKMPILHMRPIISRRDDDKDDGELDADSAQQQQRMTKGGMAKIFGAIGGFFEELDAFMDDASARRLGNGATFYGKRRSNFYGENDRNKKKDRGVFDPTEDYQGPATSGFFKWMPDENGQMRPVTRMKNQVIERKVGGGGAGGGGGGNNRKSQ